MTDKMEVALWNGKWDKPKGFSILTLAIYMCFLAFFLGLTIFPGAFKGISNSDQNLKRNVIQIDAALSVYYSSHNKTYPKSLKDLIFLGHLPENFDVTPFTYNTNDSFSLYSLSVKLDDGSTYISPNGKLQNLR